MKRKVAFKTLGCRLNQFETDAVLTDFYHANYEVVDFNEQADVYIINTCTITNQGDHKSKTAINQAVHRKDGSLVIVTGCMAENQRSYLLARGDVDFVIDNKSKVSILPIVEAHFHGELVDPDLFRKDNFGFSVTEKSFHTRSMIKIQDGCDNFCAYCIVPMVRGRAISRPLTEITDNIRKVLDLGYKEIVLTGVNIGQYEHQGNRFTGLLADILDIPGNFRVRISSVEPEGFNELFYDMFSDSKLCPHLHLCLQSGSDSILKQMHRKYSVADYLDIIGRLKSRYPLFNFTTDIMVGFPGETDDDFEETCKVIREVGFSHIHTFKYSVRKETRAERMPGHLPEKVKHERSMHVRNLSAENKLKYRRQLIGKQQTVLVERVSKTGIAKGYGEHYVPLKFQTRQHDTNYFRNITVEGLSDISGDYILWGI